ncbi:hypothetical protein ABZY11_23110, partial [Streptomyces sp. NPDC006510]
LDSPLPERAAVVRPGGGRGLRGIAERAVLLGGRTEAGPHGDGVWRLTARLPLRTTEGLCTGARLRWTERLRTAERLRTTEEESR